MYKLSNYIFGFSLVIFTACEQPVKEISNEDLIIHLKDNVEYLADDKLEGREFGTRGEQLAATYIAGQFDGFGLLPKGTDGYFQEFSVAPSLNPHEQPKIGADGDTLAIPGDNILGYVDNPGGRVIIIGAHYDHLGYGSFGSFHRGDSAVHNGADDNASGVAVMLGIAELLQSKELNHDLLFIAFTGEEKGLWGSNYFVKNPTISLDDAEAMINLDMVGRLNDESKLAIHGTGTSPVWDNLLDDNNQDSLGLIKKPSGVGPSDHTSFYNQDIPVLHFFTGQHSDYHRPEDDADKLNYEGMVAISKFIVRVIEDLDKESKIEFTKTKDESSNTPRFKVGLGVVPDYLYDGKGMRIDGVTDGKAASRAGLEKGDVVIQMGDSIITDMMSYMRALSVFEEGDTTEIKVTRNNEELVKEVIF